MYKTSRSKNILVLWLLLLFSASGLSKMVLSVNAQNRRIVGWLERVEICPENLVLRAKLDTGAKTSSLNAFNIKEFERQGEKWIRFNVVDRRGKTETVEKKLSRFVKIKEHDTDPVERPAVQLGICIGNIYKEVEVNLTDRSLFNYPMLIGRNFLKGTFMVDPATKFTIKPRCTRECVP